MSATAGISDEIDQLGLGSCRRPDADYPEKSRYHTIFLLGGKLPYVKTHGAPRRVTGGYHEFRHIDPFNDLSFRVGSPQPEPPPGVPVARLR